MRISRAVCLCGLALLVISCFDHERHAFESAISEAQSDVDAHHRIIARAGSLDAAQGELDRHAAEIDVDVDRIRARTQDLDGSCDSDDVDRVWDVVHAIEDRVSVYILDAGNVTDMSALRAVSDRYAGDMVRLFDQARDRIDDAHCW